MLKLSSCIEMMFREVPFAQRIAKAKALGFEGYEFWGYENKNLDEVLEEQTKTGLPCAGFCVGSTDGARKEAWKDGAMLKKQNAAVYAEIVEETIGVAKKLGVRTLITTTGQALPNVSREVQQEAIVECLKTAAPIAEKADVTLVLEPLNILVNHKGYYLDTSKQAFEILTLVASSHVKLLFDLYHQQITEGNLIQNFTADLDKIGHFHLADVPGRNQPGTGEINYENVLARIHALPYDQFTGCEYVPTEGTSTEDSAKLLMSIAKKLKG